MTYNYNGKNYEVDYSIDDMSEHHYEIYLFDDEGEGIDFDDLPNSIQQEVYELVDSDATARAFNESEYWAD